MYVELPNYNEELTNDVDEFINAMKTTLNDMAYNNHIKEEEVYSSVSFLKGVGYLLNDIIARIADWGSKEFSLTDLIRIILMAETVMNKYHIKPKTRFNKLLEIIEIEKEEAKRQEEDKDYSFVPIKKKYKFF